MPGSLKPIQKTETDIWGLGSDLKVHTTQDTQETGLQMIFRSLVALDKQGLADDGKRFFCAGRCNFLVT